MLTDAILLRGTTEDLAAFHDGLVTYVSGAVRCLSFPLVLDRFRYASAKLFHSNHETNAWE